MAKQQDTSRVAARFSRHRQKTREQGLRLIQMWVPDTGHPDFAEEARRQSAAVAASEHAAEDQAFIDSLSAEDV